MLPSPAISYSPSSPPAAGMGQRSRAQGGGVPAAPTSCPSLNTLQQQHKAGNRRLVPCSMPSVPATPRASGSRERKEPSQGPSTTPERPSGSSCGHGGSEICSSLRLPTPNPFATFRLPEAIGSGGRRQLPGPEPAPWRLSPRWEAGDVPSQSPELCRHSPSPTAAGSLLPSAGPMPGGLRGPGGLRSGADRQGMGSPPQPPTLAAPLLALECWQPGSQQTAEEAKLLPGSWKPPPQCPSPGSHIAPLVPTTPEPEMSLHEPGTWGSGAGPRLLPWGW